MSPESRTSSFLFCSPNIFCRMHTWLKKLERLCRSGGIFSKIAKYKYKLENTNKIWKRLRKYGQAINMYPRRWHEEEQCKYFSQSWNVETFSAASNRLTSAWKILKNTSFSSTSASISRFLDTLNRNTILTISYFDDIRYILAFCQANIQTQIFWFENLHPKCRWKLWENNRTWRSA